MRPSVAVGKYIAEIRITRPCFGAAPDSSDEVVAAELSRHAVFRLIPSRELRREQMRKDVREFIRQLEAAGLTVEPTPGHYRVLRNGKPLRKASGMPFMLPFSPDTIRWRRAAIVELRKLGIDV